MGQGLQEMTGGADISLVLTPSALSMPSLLLGDSSVF